jgi:uncharacterized protein YbjT (DUF2867 family)
MILVVGATGQLGTAVIRKLVAANKPVRAFVRRTSRYQHLQGDGVELVFGDLRDPASLDAACQGVDVVITTANAVLPEGSYSFEAVEGKGYQDLIASCQKHDVKQFIYISVPVTPHDNTVPNFRYKRLNEERLKNSGLNYTIFRSSLFMDCWFAFIGSTIPGRGTEAPTIQRQYWFLKLFMKGVGNLIEGPGTALIPGNRNIRHAFIAVDDVASYMVNAIQHPAAERAIVHIGGPEILSWQQVVDIYGKALLPCKCSASILLASPSGRWRYDFHSWWWVLQGPLMKSPQLAETAAARRYGDYRYRRRGQPGYLPLPGPGRGRRRRFGYGAPAALLG